MHIRTRKCFRLHGGSGHMPPAPARLCTRAVCGSAQAGLSPAHSPWMPLMEILLRARASGDLWICCGSCTCLLLSSEKNSQRVKQLAQSGSSGVDGGHIQLLPVGRHIRIHRDFPLTPRVLAAFPLSASLTLGCLLSTAADKCYSGTAASPGSYLSLNEHSLTPNQTQEGTETGMC